MITILEGKFKESKQEVDNDIVRGKITSRSGGWSSPEIRSSALAPSARVLSMASTLDIFKIKQCFKKRFI